MYGLMSVSSMEMEEDHNDCGGVAEERLLATPMRLMQNEENISFVNGLSAIKNNHQSNGMSSSNNQDELILLPSD